MEASPAGDSLRVVKFARDGISQDGDNPARPNLPSERSKMRRDMSKWCAYTSLALDHQGPTDCCIVPRDAPRQERGRTLGRVLPRAVRRVLRTSLRLRYEDQFSTVVLHHRAPHPMLVSGTQGPGDALAGNGSAPALTRQANIVFRLKCSGTKTLRFEDISERRLLPFWVAAHLGTRVRNVVDGPFADMPANERRPNDGYSRVSAIGTLSANCADMSAASAKCIGSPCRPSVSVAGKTFRGFGERFLWPRTR